MKEWCAIKPRSEVFERQTAFNNFFTLSALNDILPQANVHPTEIVKHTVSLLYSQYLLIVRVYLPLIEEIVDILKLLSITHFLVINILAYVMLLKRKTDFQIDHVILIVEIIVFVVHSLHKMVLNLVIWTCVYLVAVYLTVIWKTPRDDGQDLLFVVILDYLNTISVLSFNDIYDFYFFIEVAIHVDQSFITFLLSEF